MEITKKLSAKLLSGGSIKAPAAGETVWLYEVAGLASGTKHGSSNYGDWVAIMGNFIGKQLTRDDKGVYAYGKTFRTGQFFLPDVLTNLVLPATENLGKGDAVEFGFRVGVLGDESSATKYVFVAESLIPVEANDPLTMLAGKAFANAVPQIGGPVADEKTAKAK